jgi:hypothetical protein
LNKIEMEKWGELTKEGNFAFTWAWLLLKNEGRTRGEGQMRRQLWLDVIYITIFHEQFEGCNKKYQRWVSSSFSIVSLQTLLFHKRGESSCKTNEFTFGLFHYLTTSFTRVVILQYVEWNI